MNRGGVLAEIVHRDEALGLDGRQAWMGRPMVAILETMLTRSCDDMMRRSAGAIQQGISADYTRRILILVTLSWAFYLVFSKD